MTRSQISADLMESIRWIADITLGFPFLTVMKVQVKRR